MPLSEVLLMFLPNWSQIDHFSKGQLHSSSCSGKTLWVTPTPLFSRHFTLQSLSKSYLFHLKKNLEPEKLFEHPILISCFKQLLLPKWLPCFSSYFSCYHLFSNFKTYQTMLSLCSETWNGFLSVEVLTKVYQIWALDILSSFSLPLPSSCIGFLDNTGIFLPQKLSVFFARMLFPAYLHSSFLQSFSQMSPHLSDAFLSLFFSITFIIFSQSIYLLFIFY